MAGLAGKDPRPLREPLWGRDSNIILVNAALLRVFEVFWSIFGGIFWVCVEVFSCVC